MTATPHDHPDSPKLPLALDKTPPLDLAAMYPACFDLANPRPLKLGIHKDLFAIHWPDVVFPEGTRKHQRRAAQKQLRELIQDALAAYCTRPDYLRRLVLGAPRIDLVGHSAGAVTEPDAESAAMLLRGEAPPRRPPPSEPPPERPEDAPLTEENIVPGRLEITVKFGHLPTPMPVKAGMKIGVQTDSGLVVTTLPPKARKKLVQAAANYPQWLAAITGKLAAKTGADGTTVVVLEEPALQVFEKKVKPPTPTGAP